METLLVFGICLCVTDCGQGKMSLVREMLLIVAKENVLGCGQGKNAIVVREKIDIVASKICSWSRRKCHCD